MKRPRPDFVDRYPQFGSCALYWRRATTRRCPKRCEYRGEHRPSDQWHSEYREKGLRSFPAPLTGLVKR